MCVCVCVGGWVCVLCEGLCVYVCMCISLSVCVGMYLKISALARPLWFSFKVNQIIGPGKAFNYFWEGISTLQREIAPRKQIVTTLNEHPFTPSPPGRPFKALLFSLNDCFYWRKICKSNYISSYIPFFFLELLLTKLPC